VVPDSHTGEPTGFHATTAEGYAALMKKILTLNEIEDKALRTRARSSAQRFNRENFEKGWNAMWQELKKLHQASA